MQILLDDKPCDVKARTVGEAIRAAAALVERHGRVIVDVTVDGARRTGAELAAPDLNDGSADVVNLTSAVPAELVGQTFADAIDALGDLDELQREAAELLQSDRTAVAMERLDQAVSTWLAVQEALVKGTQLVGLSLDEADLPRPIGESINRLNDELKVMRRALLERDPIGLSDTLLYELPGIVEEWRSILDTLKRQIEGESQEPCR